MFNQNDRNEKYNNFQDLHENNFENLNLGGLDDFDMFYHYQVNLDSSKGFNLDVHLDQEKNQLDQADLKAEEDRSKIISKLFENVMGISQRAESATELLQDDSLSFDMFCQNVQSKSCEQTEVLPLFTPSKNERNISSKNVIIQGLESSPGTGKIVLNNKQGKKYQVDKYQRQKSKSSHFCLVKNQHQVHFLEKQFTLNPRWSSEKMEEIAKIMDLKISQVYKWNWERRMAIKKYHEQGISISSNFFKIFEVVKESKNQIRDSEKMNCKAPK
eukprot:403371757